MQMPIVIVLVYEIFTNKINKLVNNMFVKYVKINIFIMVNMAISKNKYLKNMHIKINKKYVTVEKINSFVLEYEITIGSVNNKKIK